ncbi:MAG: glycosyltransferase [Lachnospiraceae bacterium]|nr:glycosyltransferase [Lachnospiraceae bacterium]
MRKSCRIAFVSNYINHHQIPFCNAMSRLLEGEFTFVETEPMEDERVRMGWHGEERPGYVRRYYEEPQACRQLILDRDMVLFGGTDDESYIKERLEAGKPVIRVSERLYKTGQWKAVSPRGLWKKYHDHTKYRKGPVWLLCAGGYVASDFHIIRSYPGKMYCWGYFPETKHYDVETLLKEKGYGEEKIPYLLWAARMIGWKHPELPVETARYLKEKGLVFHLDIIGDGELRAGTEALAEKYGLSDCVSFLGFQPPERVRSHMERADIFLFTSDRQEGWGAVANEAMNSACALAADHMIGAVPYLVRDGENGLVYQDGKPGRLFEAAEKLAGDRAFCRKLGREAYRTITEVWNAENAARRLLELIRTTAGLACGDGDPGAAGKGGYAPCAPAKVLSERFRR